MQIRIRTTGALVREHEFRAMHPNTSMPQQLTEELLNDFDADVVFEGPQATGGTVYQYSQAAGVEQINGKWYTKYVLGPTFTGETAASDEATYVAMKDAEFQASNSNRAKQELLATDWSDLPSVRNTAIEPHLTNGAAFDTYRAALRAIVVSPPTTVSEWPVRPDAVWSTATP